MKLRQLWKLLSGVALLVTGFLLGAPAPAGATTGGCAGDVVVALDVAVWARPGHDTYGFTLDRPLPPGEWRVGASSHDGYDGRSATEQSREQWVLDITGHVVLGPTTDLADGVEFAAATDALGSFVTTTGVTHFTVRHAAPSTPSGTESVTADCVSFTRVPPPATTTTTTAPVSSTTTAPPPSTTAPPASTTTSVPPSTTAPATTVPPTTVPPPERPPPTIPPPTTVPLPEEPELRASAVVDCAAGEIYVLLGNDGDLGATVDVALPMAAVDPDVEVAGGATTSSTLAIGDLEGAAEIRVFDSRTGETYLRTPVAIDCDDPARPTASTVLDCTADVLVVVLGNEAGDPAQLTVLHERVDTVAELEVAAGETVQVDVPLDGATGVPIRVIDGDGNDVLRVRVDNICPPPDPDDDGSTDDAGDGTGDGADLGDGACDVSVMAAPECARVRVVVEPHCPRSMADVSVRRDGVGRERFVVLVGGEVAGVVAIDGSGASTIPVTLGTVDAELTVSRSTSTEPITVGVLSCGGGGGRAGPIAAALVVFAVVSSAAGVMPWPLRPGPV